MSRENQPVGFLEPGLRSFLGWFALIAQSLALVAACACYRPPAESPRVIPLTDVEGSGRTLARGDLDGATAIERVAPVLVPEPEPPAPDFQIWTRISLRLLQDDLVPSTVQVRVHEGEVWLTGTVESAVARVRAERIAGLTRTVRTVHNEIQGPEPTADQRLAGERVPEDILALEPGFAEGIRNYATNQLIETGRMLSRQPHPVNASVPGSAELPEPLQLPGPVQPAGQEQPVEPMPPVEASQLPGPAQPMSQERPVELIPAVEASRPPGPAQPQSQERPVELMPPAGSSQGDELPVQDSPPQRTYVVRAGDSLWTIATSLLGSGARWQELYEANREVIGDDPMQLQAGQILVIP